MIIVAGRLHVRAEDRADYLAAVADVAPLARESDGSLDFVQAADPVDPTRINVYERWETDDALLAFRSSAAEIDPDPEREVPEVRSAEVRKYRVASVEEP